MPSFRGNAAIFFPGADYVFVIGPARFPERKTGGAA
jgi:hypothetical protein